MTKRERRLIRICMLNGIVFCNDRRRCFIGNEMIDLDRFNAIVEEVELALDRQEPVKPINITDMIGFKVGMCGACRTHRVNSVMKYCDKCGQKIDWEVNGDE